MRSCAAQIVVDGAVSDPKKDRQRKRSVKPCSAIRNKQGRNECEERRDEAGAQFIGLEIEKRLASAGSGTVAENCVKYRDTSDG